MSASPSRLICVFTILLAETASFGQALSLRQLSAQYQALVETIDPSVVQVITRGLVPSGEGVTALRLNRGGGSGVIVDPSGYILTNAHVVGAARRVEVLLAQRNDDASHNSILKPAGKLVEARVVGQDRETDIAVLKIEMEGLPHLPFADSEAVRQGQVVVAFGSPFGLQNTVTSGIVSNVARQVRLDDPMIYIQTDAAINPGNSGGPLVDAEGRIIGINTFIVSASGANAGVGFAVPSNIARSAYEQIRQHGRVRRGQIGIVPQTITTPMARALKFDRDWGVIIADVSPRSAAEAAGLAIHDIVLKIDGKVVENARQLGVNVYQSAGKTITLEVQRGRKRLSIPVAVLERPSDPDRILSFVTGEQNTVSKLGCLAVELDERVRGILPPLRNLSGVAVAGLLAEPSPGQDTLLPGDVIHEVNGALVTTVAQLQAQVAGMQHGEPVVLHIERQGQMQYLVLEID